MKKSSAWCMLVPGLVILFLFLMIPLLRVLVPSVFTGDYPFSAYVDFFKDEYYRKIFLRTVKIAVITTFVCMVGGIPTAYFISRCDKKWRGLLLSASIFPMSLPGIIVGGILVFTGTLTAYTTPQLLGGNSNMVMATLIYQRAMSVSDWTGASVIALIMIVVTLVVIKGFNALAARLDRRGEDYA